MNIDLYDDEEYYKTQHQLYGIITPPHIKEHNKVIDMYITCNRDKCFEQPVYIYNMDFHNEIYHPSIFRRIYKTLCCCCFI